MTTDKGTLARRWDEAAGQIAAVLETGQDACFLTLGDPLLFSTYIPLLRALRKGNPDIDVITVPGITAFSAAAALTEFPVGKAKNPVTIVPATDDLNGVRRALAVGGTVVIMKIGRRLPQIMSLLEEAGLFDRAVFVARAGQSGQRVETDLGRLDRESPESGNLSIILVDTSEEATR